MKYYQDIIIVGCVELNMNFVWRWLFKGIHIGLVDLKNNCQPSANIGLSVPGYKYSLNGPKSLGLVARLFSKTKDELLNLSISNKLNRIRDYIEIKDVMPVPDVSDYVIVSSVSAGRGINMRARRMAKRHDISFDDALNKYNENDYGVKLLDLPYVIYKSDTNKNKFSKFIKVEKSSKLVDGVFDSFGLSKCASLPCF